MWLGSKLNSEEILCEDIAVSWVTRFILLGMEFDTNLQEMVKINYENKILEIEKIFNLYEKHKLSLIGKITVIKTLAIPKIVYLLTTLPFSWRSNCWETRKDVQAFYLER